MRLSFCLARLAILSAILLSLSTVGLAQFKASIQGTVSDAKGGIVPGAKVTVANQDTGVSRDTSTSDQGFYRVDQLPPGNYSVTVSASGFKQSINRDIVVEAELPRGFDVQMEIGAVNEEVTVTASNEGLQTEDASVDSTITNAQIQRLPEFARDPYELLRFSPGIVGDGSRNGSGL